MGIVVCVSMLLGWLLFLPKPWQVKSPRNTTPNGLIEQCKQWMPRVLGFVGAWNFFWYGLRHITSFWGQMAMLSGVIMMLSAMVLETERSGEILPIIKQFYTFIRPIKVVLFIGLWGCFLVYFITLVQLNLGYPIIN